MNFDDLKRFALDSQTTTLGDLSHIEKAREKIKRFSIPTLGDSSPVPVPSVFAPAVFNKICASLAEAADRFTIMYRYEDVALCELLPRLRNESLPTLWLCYDLVACERELRLCRGPFWKRYDIDDLRAILERFKLGATLEGRPLKICGIFTDRQQLDATCSEAGPQTEAPLTVEQENARAIELAVEMLKSPDPDSLTRENMCERLKTSGRCGSNWSLYRLDEYVWKQARACAGLDPRAPGGRRRRTRPTN